MNIFQQEKIYWVTSAHPLFRFPVFLMGVLGGLQVLRAHYNWEAFEDPNLEKNLLHTIQPWGWRSTNCCSKRTEGKNSMMKTKAKSTKIWRRRTDFSAFLYVGILTALAVANVSLDVIHEDEEGAYHIILFRKYTNTSSTTMIFYR